MAIVKVVHLAEGEVFFIGNLDTEESTKSPQGARLVAGMLSNPIIVVTEDPAVELGWTYDGTTFHPPVG